MSQTQTQESQFEAQEDQGQQQQLAAQQQQQWVPPPRAEGYRPAAIRESRIKDRPYVPNDSAMKIKIELDLEVEVCLHYFGGLQLRVVLYEHV
jgi:hypothetical protein